MKTIYFDGNNDIDTLDSDYMTEGEDERLADWLSNKCEHKYWDLKYLEIDGDTWTIHFYDNETDENIYMEI